MIDFRYHLVSIVAVLLALSIGVVLGTGALGGPLLEDVQNNVDELRADLQDRREENAALADRLRTEEQLSQEAEPFVLSGALGDTPVVVIQFEDVPGVVADRLRTSVGMGGGTVISTIEILNKFALEDQIDADELALELASVEGSPEDLRAEAATEMARRMTGAAAGHTGSGATAALEGLADGGFINIKNEAEEQGPVIPVGAAFLVVAGNPDEPRFDAAAFTLTLASAMVADEGVVLVAEGADSSWGVVTTIRNDGDARDAIATADGTEAAPGRIAAVLGLGAALDGDVGHYGRGSGADRLLPEPPSTN